MAGVAQAVGDRRPASLTLRVASGVVAVPLLLAVAYVGEPGQIGGAVYGGAITLATGLAAWETRGMLRAGGYAPMAPLLLGLAAFLPLDAWFLAGPPAGPWTGAPHGMLALAVAVLGGLVALAARPALERALVDWALSLALALYLGGLMQFYAPLRQMPDGAFWVMALLVSSWICDSCAYFVGGAFGRTRLAARISPKKSREGAIAGLAGAGLVAVALGLATRHPPLLMAGFGLAIGVGTILGDLVESLLKRQMGVKDSGVLVPGHGGILDRMDSLLFCGPAAVLYLLAFH